MESVELVDDRQQWLLEQLRQHRRIGTNAAAETLGVSVDTIRRDLRSLHRDGLLRRVHGGALPVSHLADSYVERSAAPSASRGPLAAAVVDRFRSGQVIGLDAGSTNVEVASLVPQTLDVTIVTNSPAAAVALGDHRSARVVLLGGTLDLTWMATTGPETVDAWRSYRLDVAVLGVCGFDVHEGLTSRSLQEVATKRAMIASAAETLVPLQAEKMEVVAPFHVSDISGVDHVLLEAATDAGTIDRYRLAGLDVSVACG